MSRLRLFCAILACNTVAGCWDFIEPEFAAENAAAVLQLHTSIDDRGNLSVTGLLVPGIDADGFRREVTRDTLYVFGLPVASDSTLPSGSLHYAFSGRVDPQILQQPYTLDPPALAGLPVVPAVRWYHPRSLDPDTIRIARGSELRLRFTIDPATPVPIPAQQWFLMLFGRDTNFQIGSNGLPPAELRIPPDFIPAPGDSVIRVALTSFQSAQPVAGLYRGAYSYSVLMDWIIILQ